MRPFLEGEPAELAKMSNVMATGQLKVRNHDNEIHIFPKNQQQTGPANAQSKSLKFDQVFGEESKQEDIYNGANVDQMIDNVLDGFHSTIFCYGQTGSGKTYTMDGYKYRKNEKGIYLPIADEEMDPSNFGLVQRSVTNLIHKV